MSTSSSSSLSVLVSGGGIAGATLAFWLGRYGFDVTVVERASDLRSSGNPVDVRDEAVAVTREMGVLPRLQELSTGVTRMCYIDGRGRRIGAVGMGGSGVEISRRHLASTLAEAAAERAEFVQGDMIETMEQHADGVEVALAGGRRGRFDLVVGADGTHSGVRRMAFGPESALVSHLGMFVGTVPLSDTVADTSSGLLPDRREIVLFNAAGRAVSLHPAGGEPVAAFIFRGGLPADFDHRDTDQHKRMLDGAYQGVGWRVPELLDIVKDSDALYFDAVSRVTLPAWSSGRVAVVGDAASSVSLFGDGSTLAVMGAKALADALAEHRGDHERAFRVYEAAHRPVVTARHRNVTRGARWLIPDSRAGLAARNLALRALNR